MRQEYDGGSRKCRGDRDGETKTNKWQMKYNELVVRAHI